MFQETLEYCQSIEIGVMCDLEQVGCQVLNEHDNLIAIDEVTSEYRIKVNADLDSEDFGSHTMNKFVLYKFSTKHLLDSLMTNSKVVQSAYANPIRIETISKTMEIYDLPTVRDVIIKFKALKNNLILFLFLFVYLRGCIA